MVRKTIQVVLSLVAVLSGIALYNLLRDAPGPHGWLKVLLASLPEIGTVLAVFELRHSAEANESRKEANTLRDEANVLRGEHNQLVENNRDLTMERNDLEREKADLERELQAERNKYLEAIAANTQRQPTQADRNAAKLRQHLEASVVVYNDDDSRWGPVQIADVSDDNILTLFQPMSQGSQAFAVFADCKDIEIMDVPLGACPIQIKVIKRHGNTLQLGEITRWKERKSPAAAPIFEKGELAYRATYTKMGSSEMRTIFIYAAKNGGNSFLLEASTGERSIADNKEVSKMFFSVKVDYIFAGFIESNAGDGVRPFPLYLR
jgi:hypothetical protein